VNKEATSKTSCWRSLDAHVLCDGSPNLVTLYLGIPVMLIVEFGDILHRDNKWNIPKHIRPLTREAEEQHSLIYDVVGLVVVMIGGRAGREGARITRYDLSFY